MRNDKFPEVQSLICFSTSRYLYKNLETYNKLLSLLDSYKRDDNPVKRATIANEIHFLHRRGGVLMVDRDIPVLVIENMDDKLFKVLYREQVGYMIFEVAEGHESPSMDSIGHWYLAKYLPSLYRGKKEEQQ